MKKIFTFLLVLASIWNSKAIANDAIFNTYQQEMDYAYQQFPNIPKGILEAVSYTQTHFSNLNANTPESCFSLPKAYGPMGLVLNGQGYFKNVIENISNYSSYSIQQIQSNPQKNILAYAEAYSYLLDSLSITSINEQDRILRILSEIPISHNVANDFALNSFVYSVFNFMENPSNQQTYGFPSPNIDMVQVFGQDNLEVLASSQVQFIGNSIQSANGTSYTGSNLKSAEFGPALWVATPSCNYSSRSGTAVSAVTIHTIQGTYAGAISWAQNCSANVSYHYVVRSSDGQITQMVLEADKAWHVGSENPYTIGIEHEGYISDPSWYTTALYTASADLCRDITQSGYGISPLRTFFGDATTGTNVIGGCTKIKGHQHYPNQTHTDPGINWDWENFYKLINNTPTYTTYSANSGNLYDSGGAAGDYSDDERTLYLIQPTSAGSVTITFNSFDIEQDWDYMFIYDGSTPDDVLIGKYTGTTIPTTITSTGGSLLLEFRSDCATTAPGWEISYTSTQTDNTIPTTTVTSLATWQTMDFNVNFTDNDNVAVTDSFYQVADFDGSEWTSNDNYGFYNDEFDQTLSANWTQSLGTWATNSGALEQSDETVNNSNLYANLTQSGNNSYLYHWKGQINGTGTNRRSGMHFFCDDPTLDQRGNSYMVYWRVDQNKCQIYEVNSNNIVLMTDDTVVVDPNIWYDFKIYYNPQSGVIKAFLDDELVSQWTDTTPLTSGNSISMRNGNSYAIYDDLKVYKSRSSNELITLGTTGELRYQNPNPTTPSGRVSSIVLDGNDNWSIPQVGMENIDWTPPTVSTYLNDGVGNDIDTTNVGTELSANWDNAIDPHSDVVEYFYCIGTTAGGTDIVGWTSNGTSTSVTHTGMSLSANTIYYFSIKCINGAGLYSTIIDSDGQRYVVPTAAPVAGFTPSSTTICETETIQLSNTSTNATSYSWTTTGGTISNATATNPTIQFTTSGSYTVQLSATGPGGTDVTSQILNVTVVQSPIASATPSATTFTLPSATVNFTNTSSNATSYFWNFGDGNTSTTTNPSNTYTSAGTYDVMLIAMNGSCANDTSYITITVNAQPPVPPVASYTTSSTTICNGDLIQLNNNSQDATSYSWSSTGGTFSSTTAQNPTITFTTSGSYDIQLTATGPGGTDVFTNTIPVTVMYPPVASATPSNTTASLPNATINFTNTSTDATSYYWDFGDGNTSTSSNPSNTYSTDGTYTVMLVAINGSCANDTTYFTITVQPAGAPVAQFSSSSTTICSGEIISLTNSSTDATSYSWTTSGGTLSSTSATNPTLSVTNSGSYTVQLTANGPGGTDVYSQTLTVTLQDPTASATLSNNNVTLPGATVSFTNTSTNATSYYWDFGDGNISTNTNPTYTYSTAGTYTVMLIASNGNCPDDTTYFTVTVNPAAPSPIASFSANTSTPICVTDSFQITNNSVNATSYVWSCNGGTFSSITAFEPTISFATSGTYTITLTASGAGGTDVSSTSINVTIYQIPVATIHPSADTVYLPSGIVTFVNSSTDATDYLWSFGDGNTSTDQNTWNTYSATGDYVVELIASNGYCPNDTVTETITVMGGVGISEEQLINQVNVYPTPATDFVNLYFSLSSEQNISIQIVDIAGRLVHPVLNSKNYSKGEHIENIDVSSLANGTYQLLINSDKIKLNKTIIISK